MEGGTQSNEHALQNAIQDNHTELISKIHELQTTVQECKDAQVQKQQKEAENEERTRKEQVPSTSNLLHLAQKLLEIRDSQRRSSIRDSATSQNNYQSIIDEMRLHHHQMQNIITEKLAFPSSSSYADSLSEKDSEFDDNS